MDQKSTVDTQTTCQTEPPRLGLKLSVSDAVFAMANNNPGALTVLIDLISIGEKVDPSAAMGGMTHLTLLDEFKIYEDRIYMLFKDVCRGNIAHMIALLRAVQLGALTRGELNHAIDNYGEGLDVEAIVGAVCSRLGDFRPKATKAQATA